MRSVKGKGERILLSEGERLWFPVHPRMHPVVCEWCDVKGQDDTGAEGSSGVSFQAKAFQGTAGGIFSVGSLQWNFFFPKQTGSSQSPSRKALLESSAQQVDLGCRSIYQALNCEYVAKEILITTHSSPLALHFLTLLFADWKTAMERYEPTCRAISLAVFMQLLSFF